jgi:phosphohistidine phosphatase
MNMDLILWRHAEAEDGAADLARRLTPKGVKQAKQMADWLRPRLPKGARVVSSPAERARQTAAALTDDFAISRDVAPGRSCGSILDAVGWPQAGGAVVLVGHQPSLGEAAAFLLCGEVRAWSLKKGAVWWLKRRIRSGDAQVVLKAAISPELL